MTVDADTARRLIGAETKNVDRAVTLGDWTFTVESLVLDENGIGVLTFTAENPGGVDGGLEVTADGEAMFNGEAGAKDQAGGKVTYPKFGLIAGHDGEAEESQDTRYYLSGEGRTDTKVRIVAYMGAIRNVEGLESCDTLRAVFQITRPYKWRPVLDDLFPPGDDKLRETAVIDIPLTQMAQTVALSSPDGWRAEVSPLGLVIHGSEAALAVSRHVGDEIDAVVIRYTDGTEYVVTSEEPYIENNMLGYMPGDGSVRWVLNRLIDPSQVASVTVSGGLYASTAGDKTPFETALTP